MTNDGLAFGLFDELTHFEVHSSVLYIKCPRLLEMIVSLRNLPLESFKNDYSLRYTCMLIPLCEKLLFPFFSLSSKLGSTIKSHSLQNRETFSNTNKATASSTVSSSPASYFFLFCHEVINITLKYLYFGDTIMDHLRESKISFTSENDNHTLQLIPVQLFAALLVVSAHLHLPDLSLLCIQKLKSNLTLANLTYVLKFASSLRCWENSLYNGKTMKNQLHNLCFYLTVLQRECYCYILSEYETIITIKTNKMIEYINSAEQSFVLYFRRKEKRLRKGVQSSSHNRMCNVSRKRSTLSMTKAEEDSIDMKHCSLQIKAFHEMPLIYFLVGELSSIRADSPIFPKVICRENITSNIISISNSIDYSTVIADLFSLACPFKYNGHNSPCIDSLSHYINNRLPNKFTELRENEDKCVTRIYKYNPLNYLGDKLSNTYLTHDSVTNIPISLYSALNLQISRMKDNMHRLFCSIMVRFPDSSTHISHTDMDFSQKNGEYAIEDKSRSLTSNDERGSPINRLAPRCSPVPFSDIHMVSSKENIISSDSLTTPTSPYSRNFLEESSDLEFPVLSYLYMRNLWQREKEVCFYTPYKAKYLAKSEKELSNGSDIEYDLYNNISYKYQSYFHLLQRETINLKAGNIWTNKKPFRIEEEGDKEEEKRQSNPKHYDNNRHKRSKLDNFSDNFLNVPQNLKEPSRLEWNIPIASIQYYNVHSISSMQHETETFPVNPVSPPLHLKYVYFPPNFELQLGVNGPTFMLHKEVLTCRSGFFSSLCHGGGVHMRESKEKEIQKCVLEISPVPLMDSFLLFVHYLYTGTFGISARALGSEIKVNSSTARPSRRTNRCPKNWNLPSATLLEKRYEEEAQRHRKLREKYKKQDIQDSETANIHISTNETDCRLAEALVKENMILEPIHALDILHLIGNGTSFSEDWHSERHIEESRGEYTCRIRKKSSKKSQKNRQIEIEQKRKLQKAGGFFQLSCSASIRNECYWCIRTRISPENAIPLLCRAYMVGHEKVKKFSLAYIVKHYRTVVLLPTFHELELYPGLSLELLTCLASWNELPEPTLEEEEISGDKNVPSTKDPAVPTHLSRKLANSEEETNQLKLDEYRGLTEKEKMKPFKIQPPLIAISDLTSQMERDAPLSTKFEQQRCRIKSNDSDKDNSTNVLSSCIGNLCNEKEVQQRIPPNQQKILNLEKTDESSDFQCSQPNDQKSVTNMEKKEIKTKKDICPENQEDTECEKENRKKEKHLQNECIENSDNEVDLRLKNDVEKKMVSSSSKLVDEAECFQDVGGMRKYLAEKSLGGLDRFQKPVLVPFLEARKREKLDKGYVQTEQSRVSISTSSLFKPSTLKSDIEEDD